VSEEAGFLYRFLATPVRKIGEFDEREYFLGELALLAGGANRILFRREEARRWFDRAESNFVRVANASVHFARLAYQRLGLAAEERRFEEILELAPAWSQNSQQLGLPEDSLKCRFLEGIALWETGNAEGAIRLYREIYLEAESLGIPRLAAQAASNLAHYHSSLGDTEEALAYSKKALPILKQLENRVHLAKLQWSIGDLLRSQGKAAEAVDAYRSALHESEEIGLRGDVAAIHLVVADLLLDADQEAQAEWEVRAALPIIDEEQMVPEGFAALSLLRESLRRRKIDRQALRNLHGYFRE
jgi:tetratricopeptide (TPR) repeat protein